MRSPNGDLTTQFSLHDAESLGDVKYDLLVTEVCDKLTTCIELLQRDAVLDPNKSLREIYDEYLHPAKLNLKDQRLWDALGEGTVLDVFQFNTGVGLATAKMVKPQTPEELASANTIMRLMGEKGKERPLDRYCRLKNDMSQWYKEVRDYGLSEEEIKILEPYYLPNYGVPASQEDLMMVCMDKNIGGFSLKDANAARKTVSKKRMEEIPILKEKFLSSCPSRRLGEYVWDTTMGPQMGYAFAKPHSTAYSFVGIQTLYLATNFPAIYWNCACLIVNAGGAELLDREDVNDDEDGENKKKNKSVNYGKISAAIGESKKNGILVLPPNINKSGLIFKPDLNHGAIIYGLKGINRIGSQLVYDIIKHRPYDSIEDFLEKIKVNKLQMISLIKSGAFDSFGKRVEIMKQYLNSVADKKKRITLQNMQMLITKDMIPETLTFEKQVFNFNKYLKKFKEKTYYRLDNVALKFFKSKYDDNLLKNIKVSGNSETALLDQSTWDSIYKKEMNPVRDWMKANQEELLNNLNSKLFNEIWDKYALGDLSKWEMDSLGFYYHNHELGKLKNEVYYISNFYSLGEEPTVERTFSTKDGKEISIFKINRIAGTVIDKDKNKSSVTLLTTTGVVTIKVWKNQFAAWDKQVFRRNADGTKTILEKSWFTRGNKLIITGIRRGDDFVPKKYKNTEYPLFEKIISLDDRGFITESTTERIEGDN